MTSDGHDTSVTVAGEWLKGFLTPLLEDKNFMDNTLVMLTFDENESYSIVSSFNILCSSLFKIPLVDSYASG
jgi:acid phosphatase